MKLKVFQARDGDCLLLSGEKGGHILVDGGRRTSFRDHVAKELSETVGDAGLDLVCVSHVDNDHISGVLRLMDDTVDWRVREFRRAGGEADFPEPAVPRPPAVRGLWHNAFRDMAGDNTGQIAQLLVLATKVLGTRNQTLPAAETLQKIVTGYTEALQLSARAGPEQLKIPVNPEFDGGLMWIADPPDVFRIAQMEIRVVGPFAETLSELREDWNKWLNTNQSRVEELRREAKEDQERLGLDDGQTLARAFAAATARTASRGRVTIPNLASLMLLVEEDGKAALLTGDGAGEDVIAGLVANDRLVEGGHLHVDVLKMPHHGSVSNVDRHFCDTITADHYLFCGASGRHENPGKKVIEYLLDSRRGASNPVDRPFTLWFTGSARSGSAGTQRHMAEIEDQVRSAATDFAGRMRFRFLATGAHRFLVEP